MMTLITGGSKCGKSHYAEGLFDRFDGQKFYIATMQPFGEEAYAAIRRHKKLRMGKGFETIEKYTDLHEITLPEECGVLLECMGNLCANEMFSGEERTDPVEKILQGIAHLKSHARRLVVVTNDVGSDGISYDSGTAEYIRALGEINRHMAEIADHVTECIYGIPVHLKGKQV